ncbi:site-specific integrase [Mesorhizobium sp. M00.F.Ca.ET.186.01.1.1]|nr:site-specific integrase [bacterium M00.F.Ca.ET.205.01.1.1]TGU51741.1 site-specific integrase [bacterium M00.F.Ca.ET.152.01.1.1]TGV33140.1 site-specific integrase [Mesorhizobium sp. M00.F.Ca.ET.186.01.1.1]TGZ42280.1 site-specific integrase [bacterium M00.F.Ca.ET.162.01.1.1]
MPRKLPKGVSPDRDRHGNVRLYFRAPGQSKVRLRERPGTQEFETEVACARLNVPYSPLKTIGVADWQEPVSLRSFRWLCQEYKRRVRLSPKILTRRSSVLDEICDSLHKGGSKRGALPFDLLERKHVLEIRDDLRSTPGAQNEVVKVISAMYGWAVENDLVKTNPALGVKRLRSGDGFHTWSRGEVRQFEARHPLGSKARLALHLGLFTGLRRQDLAILGRQHVTNGWLHIRPQKTSKSSGVEVELPLLPELRATIDATACGDLTFLVSEWGTPFTVNSLGNKMRDWCDQAELPHCTLHGLRKAGATIAAENGATDEQLMAIFGWTTKQQTTHYTRKAQRRRMAEHAAHLLVIPEQNQDKIVPPKKSMTKGGTKIGKKLGDSTPE